MKDYTVKDFPNDFKQVFAYVVFELSFIEEDLVEVLRAIVPSFFLHNELTLPRWAYVVIIKNGSLPDYYATCHNVNSITHLNGSTLEEGLNDFLSIQELFFSSGVQLKELSKEVHIVSFYSAQNWAGPGHLEGSLPESIKGAAILYEPKLSYKTDLEAVSNHLGVFIVGAGESTRTQAENFAKSIAAIVSAGYSSITFEVAQLDNIKDKLIKDTYLKTFPSKRLIRVYS